MEGNAPMTKKKVIHSPKSIALADTIIKTYDPKTTEDVQEIIKSAFGPIFETILKGELENHLGYSSNDESKGTNQWLKIFDEIKTRGVEDVLFISMDGLKGLKEGAKAIFPDAVVQRCINHLVRNSIKYVPSKDRKTFVIN